MESLIAGIIFTVCGLIGVAGGLLEWELVMNPAHNYKLVNALGPKGKRIFYVVVGLFVFGVGIAFLVGALQFLSVR